MSKKLYRSRENRMIAGVCGGLGEYFNIDPTLIRLAAVFFSLWWGGGILLYLLAWFIIPEAPEPSEQRLLPPEPSASHERDSTLSDQDI